MTRKAIPQFSPHSFASVFVSRIVTLLISHQRIDVAAALLTLTKNRSEYINYLGPFLISTTAILGARVVSDSDVFKVFRPFDTTVWFLIVLSFVLTGLGMYAINRITPFSAWNLGLPGAISDEVTARENMWSVLSSLLLQGKKIV